MSLLSDPEEETGADRRPLPDDTPVGSEESFDDKRLPTDADALDHVATESLVRQHEVQEVNVQAIVRFGLGLLAAAIIIHLALWWYLSVQTRQSLAVQVQLPPAEVTPVSETGPGIEEAPAAERAAQLSPALERLRGYGWVDEEAGTVRIPIEQAIELLAEQGLPAAENESAPAFGLDAAYRADSSGGRTLTTDHQ
jgi:hypothetical protein